MPCSTPGVCIKLSKGKKSCNALIVAVMVMMIPNCSIYRYVRSECWCSVSVCIEVVTAFMKHVMSHVSGWTDGSELIDAGWSVSNAVWLVAYRM